MLSDIALSVPNPNFRSNISYKPPLPAVMRLKNDLNRLINIFSSINLMFVESYVMYSYLIKKLSLIFFAKNKWASLDTNFSKL